MTTLTSDKIKEILDGARDINHFGVYKGGIVPMHNTCGTLHNTSDLREILTLRERVDKLEGILSEIYSIGNIREDLLEFVGDLEDIDDKIILANRVKEGG